MVLELHRRLTWFLRWGLRHTFALWQPALALVESLAVQASSASLWTGVVKTFR